MRTRKLAVAALVAAGIMATAPLAHATDEALRLDGSQPLSTFAGLDAQALSAEELDGVRAEGRYRDFLNGVLGGGNLGNLIHRGVEIGCTRIYRFC